MSNTSIFFYKYSQVSISNYENELLGIKLCLPLYNSYHPLRFIYSMKIGGKIVYITTSRNNYQGNIPFYEIGFSQDYLIWKATIHC